MGTWEQRSLFLHPHHQGLPLAGFQCQPVFLEGGLKPLAEGARALAGGMEPCWVPERATCPITAWLSLFLFPTVCPALASQVTSCPQMICLKVWWALNTAPEAVDVRIPGTGNCYPVQQNRTLWLGFSQRASDGGDYPRFSGWSFNAVTRILLGDRQGELTYTERRGGHVTTEADSGVTWP